MLYDTVLYQDHHASRASSFLKACRVVSRRVVSHRMPSYDVLCFVCVCSVFSPSVRPSVRLSVRPSIHPSIHPSAACAAEVLAELVPEPDQVVRPAVGKASRVLRPFRAVGISRIRGIYSANHPRETRHSRNKVPTFIFSRIIFICTMLFS